MKPRTLRIVRTVGIGLAVLAVVVLAVLGAALTIPAAARFAVGAAARRAPVPVVVGSVSGPLRGPLILEDVRVERDGARVDIQRLVLDWRPLALLARAIVVDSLHVSGVSGFVPEGVPPATEAPPEPEGSGVPPAVPDLPVSVEVRDVRVSVEHVDVAGRGAIDSAELQVTGSLEDFTLDFRVAGAGDPVEQLSLAATVRGAPEAYRLVVSSAFTSGGLPPVDVRIEGAGSMTGLRLDSARVRTENGYAVADGDVSWYPEVAWEVSALASLLDVAPLTPDPAAWPGHVSFVARSEGRLTDDGVVASARVSDLSGSLRDEPLSGGLSAEVDLSTVSLEELQLRWGDIEVLGSGGVLDTADLDVLVRIPDLGQLLPGAAGRVVVEAAVAGELERPRVVAEMTAAGVRVDSLAVREVVGSLDAELGVAEAPVRMRARAEGLVSGGTEVDSLSVEVEGSQGSHDVLAGVWLPELGFGLRADGSLELPSGDEGGVPSWTGRLDSLTVATARAGEWSLVEPSSVFASADSVTLTRTCLRQGATGACAEGERDALGAIEALLEVEALPLAALPVRPPSGVTVEGQVDARARVSLGADGTLRSTGSATTSGSSMAVAGADTVRLDFGGEGLSLEIDSAGARATAGLELQPRPEGAPFLLSARATLPGLTSTEIDPETQLVDGAIRIDSEDLSFLAAFLPGIGALEGRFALDAVASGTLGEPALRGQVEMADGRVTVPEAGLDLHAIRVVGQADPAGGIALEGSVRSGEGEIRMEGRAPLEPSASDPARLSIEGERFRAVATPEIRVEVAPDVEVAFDGSTFGVEGEVAVPWARVELVEIPPAAVAPSSDVVIVDEEPVPTPQVDARIRVLVGDDVRFSGLGFTSMIEGDLNVRELPGAPPTVIGELRFVDGRYRAYGQDLEIDPGRLVFSGPVEDVGLDVTALRTAQDGTEAGLVVRGAATSPEITLTSDPAMPDADVLSYILYGKPLSDGSASEQGQVAGAAATLGANVLTTRLASQVGLDDARIEGTTRDQAELVAGKYLTPSIYVSYGVGLFRPSTTFRIKYLLNSNWALQAESGEANGGDILYQIERGR